METMYGQAGDLGQKGCGCTAGTKASLASFCKTSIMFNDEQRGYRQPKSTNSMQSEVKHDPGVKGLKEYLLAVIRTQTIISFKKKKTTARVMFFQHGNVHIICCFWHHI